MYRGFDANIDGMSFQKAIDSCRTDLWADLIREGKSAREHLRNEIKAKVISGRWVISGSDMESNWFPKILNHVFISHSHKDENLALAIAGLLKRCFGIDSFVDSSVWGYYADLQTLIYEKVCQLRNVTNTTLQIELKNSAASHVHCMLTKSLIQMMDQCECLMFLNTPSSIGLRDINGNQETYSPWIYTEVEISRLLRTHLDSRRPRKRLIKESMECFGEDADIDNIISYPLNLDHMTKLDSNIFWSWMNKAKSSARYITNSADTPFVALDELYKLA